jgi:sensor domain CHASE-containing protein
MDDKKNKFSIRKKVTIAVLIFSLLFSIFISFFSIKVILKSYENIENDVVDINIKRVKFSIDYLLENQAVKLKDWSVWDETYNFVKDKNNTYIEDNLQNTGLVNLNINFMVFVDSNRDIVYSKVINLNTGEDLDADLISNFVKRQESLLSHSEIDNSISGIFDTPYGLSIVSSAPVLHNDGSGPISGSLIFGNFLDDNSLKNVSDLIMYPVSVFNYNGNLPDDVVFARENLLNNDNYVRVLSDDNIAGYIKLKNYDNEPVAIVKIFLPRDFYSQGLRSFLLFIMISSLLFLLFAFGAIYLIEKIILRKFIKLTKDIKEIGVSGDFEKRIEVIGSDEFADLANSINGMIDKIKYLRDREILSLEQEKNAINNLKMHVERTGKLNKLMVKRELKMIELKKEIEKLKKSNNS